MGDQCKPAGFDGCPDGSCAIKTDCGKGKVATLGGECKAIGPESCPAGFEKHESGFGCIPIVTTSTCAGATRPKIGETTCVPVGDCAAAFPPAGATIFVDDSFTAGQVDATHFKTIEAAVASAPDGAVIAIEEGSYTGTVSIAKPMTLIGRCPDKVKLIGSAAAAPGLEVGSKIKGTFRGMTVTGFEVAVSGAKGAEIEASELVLEANRKSAILGGDAGTKILAKNIVIRGTLQDGSTRFGYGAQTGFEAEATLEDSAILDSFEIGAGSLRAGRINVVRSIIKGVKKRPTIEAYGWGVGTQTGGQATVTESVVLDTFGGGVVSAGEGCKTRVERSYVSGVQKTGDVASCALAQEKGAVLEIEGSTLAGSVMDGVRVIEESTATIRSTIVRDLEAGSLSVAAFLVGAKSSATIDASGAVSSSAVGFVVSGSLDASNIFAEGSLFAAMAVRGRAKVNGFVALDVKEEAGGSSASGGGVLVDSGGSVEASDVVMRRAPGLGFLVTGANAKLDLKRAFVEDTKSFGPGSGFGLAVVKGAALNAEDAVIAKSRDIGVQIADANTTATLTGVAVIDTLKNGVEERGRQINVQDGAQLTLVRSLVRGGTQVGVNVVGEGARATINDSVIANVVTTKNGFGHGLAITQGGVLVMTHSIVREHAGVGFVFSEASGSIASSIVRGNPIGVNTQDGVSLVEAASVPAELNPLEVVFSTDTKFEDNGTKVGSGALPLPPKLSKAVP